MHKKYYTLLISVFVITVAVFVSSPVFSAEKKEQTQTAQEEGPRLSKEANRAMVDAFRLANDENNLPGARKALLDYIATEKAKEGFTDDMIYDQVYLMLGVYWYDENKFKEAVDVFKLAHKIYPEHKDILKYYAASLYSNEQFKEAGPLMEKVYDSLETKETQYLELAMQSYYQSENLEEAKRILKKMIGLTDTPKESWYSSLIIICQDQEKYVEAEKYLWDALGYFPMNYNYWQTLIYLSQEKGDNEGVVSAYEISAHVKPPKKEKEWKSLINNYRFMGLPLRTAKTVLGFLKSAEKPKDEDYILIAQSYAQAFKVDEAVAYLDKIIAQNPSQDLMFEKAKILYSARRNKETIKAVEELSDKYKNAGQAYMMMGYAAWDLRDWDTAKKAYRKARDVSKDLRAPANEILEVIQNLEEARDKIEFPDYYNVAMKKK